MTLYQNILMWVSLVAAFALAAAGVVVWCDLREVLPGWRILHAFMRLPWLVRLFLVAFVVQLVVHGSTKTSQTNGVEGGTTNAPTMTGGVITMPSAGARTVRGDVVQPEAGRVPSGAVLAQKQWRRGCWEDWLSVSFEDGWVFPHGTNHLSRVAVMTQGELRTGVRDTDAVASLGAKVAHVPFDTCFYHELTPSNSYRFVWDRAYVDRNTNMPMYATIELFRNGNTCVTTNGVAAFTPREIPFPHIGIGQNDDWVRTNFVNAADILSVGYANWVDDQVGVDLENGLYKFTATFTENPPEATQLTVGDFTVCVTNAGEYIFLMEKGVEYTFGTEPYDAAVEYSMQDDAGPVAPIFTSWWWGGDTPGEWTVDGDDQYISEPTLIYLGYCFWEPKFRGSSDVTNLSTADFPMTFTAVFDNAHTNGVTYHWTTENEKVYIESPYAQTTQVSLDSAFDVDTFVLTVEAYMTNRTYQSTLLANMATNNVDGFSFSMPDVLFVNNDDDDNGGQRDAGPGVLLEDDVASGTIALSYPNGTGGTIELVGIDGFVGDVYEDSGLGYALVSPGASWRVYDSSTYDKTLYFDAQGRSWGYRQSRVRVRWTPDGGDSVETEHRFTVVEPIVEPICNERKDVTENGVARSLTVNPCGVGIGRDAYFRVQVKPNAFPDSKIEWSTFGAGSVSFPDGNAGREVRVRGLGAGDVELQIRIGDCDSSAPSFPLRVVENKTIKLSAWIMADDGGPVCSESDVRTAVKNAEDVYAQVGVTFDVGDRIVVTNISAAVEINECVPSEDHWSYSNLVDVATGTGGIELYIVNSIIDDSTPLPLRTRILGLNGRRGLVVAASAMKRAVVHEIGHVIGLDDIYENKGGVSVGISFACFDNMVRDWNNGCNGRQEPGSRYYVQGTTQADIIRRLLMHGYDGGGTDIPAGMIFGVGWSSGGYLTNQVDVGAFYPARQWQMEHQ